MDLQYFTVTLNSGLNSVMVGYGSVRVTVLRLFFVTVKETEIEQRRETDV